MSPAAPLLGALKVSPRYAAVMWPEPAAVGAKVCWHVDWAPPVVMSEQLAGGPNEPAPKALKSTVPVGGLTPAVSVTVAVQIVAAGSVTAMGEQATLVAVA
jgi:hypothetical protein